jgi:hypothetical protein
MTEAKGFLTPYALFNADHHSLGVADPTLNGAGAEAEPDETVRS